MKLLVIILAILTTILTAVCETVTFGTKVISTIATIFTDFVIAWATWEIMKFNKKQTEIAEQQRKDDLFNLRWELYQEIIKYIKQKIDLEVNDNHSHSELQYGINYYGFRTEEEFFEYTSRGLITKTQLLFDDEIADWLKKVLVNGFNEEVGGFNNQLLIWETDDKFIEKFKKYLKL